MRVKELTDTYRRTLNLPQADFQYIDHEDAMVAKALSIQPPPS